MDITKKNFNNKTFYKSFDNFKGIKYIVSLNKEVKIKLKF